MTAVLGAARHYSQAHVAGCERPWNSYWTHHKPMAPSAGVAHPQPYLRSRLRKDVTEWRVYHGHGWTTGLYGPTREIADWEFADGTPAPHSLSRYMFLAHRHDLLRQVIRAGAIVEELAALNQLPRIPATPEQRAWDPELPLFLDDLDERGRFIGATPGAPRRTSAASKRKSVTDVVRPKNFSSEEVDGFEPLELRLSAAQDESQEYEPSAMFRESEVAKPPGESARPYWNRRLWNLTNDFFIPKAPKNKNFIDDE